MIAIAPIAKRFGRGLFAIWAVVTISFFLHAVLPSDPARIAAGPQARPQDVAAIREEMGLDRGVLARYGIFLGRLVHLSSEEPPEGGRGKGAHASCKALGPVHFDLGKSYQQRRGVLTVLAERLPRTLMLAVVALLFQLLFGVTLGSWAAKNKGALLSRAFMSGSLLGVSLPTFVLGVILQYVFAHRLGLLPLDGYGNTWPEHVKSVILPGLTLGIYGAAYYARLTRDEVEGELASDYVRTARAKGASPTRALVVHALRNALLPISTAAALDLGALVGGAIVTESVFRWPGIGSLGISALLDRDGPVLMGTVLVTAAAVVLSNMLADATYGALDPRTRK